MSLFDPFYSIILPVNNAERTLEKCLLSIAAQNFKNYELIIVDGLSKDRSMEIINQHRPRFKNIKVISGKDESVYHAMNKGVQLSGGKWLYFIGADDYLYDPEVLTKVHNELDIPARLDLFYGNVKFSSSGKIYNGKYNFPRLLITNICHQSCFISRDAFKKYGPFDRQFRVYADWDLNLKIFMNSKAIAYADIVIAEYNDGSGISHGSKDKAFEEKRIAIKTAYYSQFMPRLHKTIIRVKRFIKKSLFPSRKTQLSDIHR